MINNNFIIKFGIETHFFKYLSWIGVESLYELDLCFIDIVSLQNPSRKINQIIL